MTREPSRLGGRVRALRRRVGLSQVQLAERLGISASYLNLIENNRRPLPGALLIKLARHFEVDLDAFAADSEGKMVADLLELFADPFFDAYDLASSEVRELVAQNPGVARAVLALYSAYKSQRDASESLASRVAAREEGAVPGAAGSTALPSEEVSDLIQRHMNHFPELEAAAEDLRRRAHLEHEEAYSGLIRYLERAHRIQVRIAHWGAERGIVRRYDAEKRILTLSELLPTRSRTFNLAHQLALLEQHPTLDRLTCEPAMVTSDASRTLARVALANYFAGAVMMPYAAFREAAREERYDLDVLGRRFRVGFEQVCHRLTTLRRPGAEGIPFHMIRIDVAGNISKRFSGSGIRFARFSGACPRWNIFAAFMTPGMIRIQVSRMPDGAAYFCVARTIQKDSGGYHSQQPVLAIGLGCQLSHGKEMVYADGLDLANGDIAIPVGVTCRLCERAGCEQRAFPSMKQPLAIDENIRGASLYAPAPHLDVLP